MSDSQSRIVKLQFEALKPRFARAFRVQQLISTQKKTMSSCEIIRFFCEVASDAKEAMGDLVDLSDKQKIQLETCLDHNETLQRENEKLSKRNENLSKSKAKKIHTVTEQSREEWAKLQGQLSTEREELIECREALDCKMRHLNEATQKQEQQRAWLQAKDEILTERTMHLNQQISLLKTDRRLYRELVEKHHGEIRHDQTLLDKHWEMPRSKALTAVQECHTVLRDALQASRKDKEGKLRMELALIQIEQLCASLEESIADGNQMDFSTDLGWEAVESTTDDDWSFLAGVVDAAAQP